MLIDIHFHIYLLMNDTANTIALYSTVKCDGVYTVSFISRYIYVVMNIYSHIYLLINDTAYTIALYIQYCKVQRCDHVLFIVYRYMCKCALKFFLPPRQNSILPLGQNRQEGGGAESERGRNV